MAVGDPQVAALERLRMLAIRRMAGDRIDADELIRAGLDAVLAGIESTSLELLAGLGPQEQSEAPSVFDDVVTELALVNDQGHNKVDARWTLVRWLATMIVDDELDIVDGARRIQSSWQELGTPDELAALVSWLAEYDAWSPLWSVPREFYVDLIRDEARRISSQDSTEPTD